MMHEAPPTTTTHTQGYLSPNVTRELVRAWTQPEPCLVRVTAYNDYHKILKGSHNFHQEPYDTIEIGGATHTLVTDAYKKQLSA